MKKTLSYVLMFSLCFFSFFSTGCRSGGGFKFLGAVVTGAIALSSGGAAAPVFAANIRGANVEKVKINDKNAEINIYKLNNNIVDLKGDPVISNKSVTLSTDGKLNFEVGDDERLRVGEYLFIANHKEAKQPFLRAILSVLGNSNELTLEISPTTEVKTLVYENWTKKDHENKSYVNFEANIRNSNTKKQIENNIIEKAAEHLKNLVTWSSNTDKVLDVVDTKDIDVPTKNIVKNTPEDKGNADSEFLNQLPTALKTYTWNDLAIKDLEGQKFCQVYQRNNSIWYELKEEEKENFQSIDVPDMRFYEDFQELDKDEISAYTHDYTASFMKWILEQSNDENVVILPRLSSVDHVTTIYEEPLDSYMKDNNMTALIEVMPRFDAYDISINNAILQMSLILSGTTEENPTGKVVDHEVKIGVSGANKYLYLKDKEGGDLAERIYKLQVR